MEPKNRAFLAKIHSFDYDFYPFIKITAEANFKVLVQIPKPENEKRHFWITPSEEKEEETKEDDFLEIECVIKNHKPFLAKLIQKTYFACDPNGLLTLKIKDPSSKIEKLFQSENKPKEIQIKYR